MEILHGSVLAVSKENHQMLKAIIFAFLVCVCGDAKEMVSPIHYMV